MMTDAEEISMNRIVGPRNSTERELAKFSIRKFIGHFDPPVGMALYCLACKKTWTISCTGHQRKPKGWWRCPNGCNVPMTD